MSSTAGGGSTQTDGPDAGPAGRLGFKPGMVIQELGWDNDTDDELRVAVEDCIDADMVEAGHPDPVSFELDTFNRDDVRRIVAAMRAPAAVSACR